VARHAALRNDLEPELLSGGQAVGLHARLEVGRNARQDRGGLARLVGIGVEGPGRPASRARARLRERAGQRSEIQRRARRGRLDGFAHTRERGVDSRRGRREQVEALVQRGEVGAVVRTPEVDDLDGLRAPDAVQAADALLQAHGVPRQVPVHHALAELEVAALAARLAAEQQRLLALAEARQADVIPRENHRSPRHHVTSSIKDAHLRRIRSIRHVTIQRN